MLFGKRYYLRLSKSFHLDKFEILSAAYSVADFFIQSRSRFRINLAGKRIKMCIRDSWRTARSLEAISLMFSLVRRWNTIMSSTLLRNSGRNQTGRQGAGTHYPELRPFRSGAQHGYSPAAAGARA